VPAAPPKEEKEESSDEESGEEGQTEDASGNKHSRSELKARKV
jgi:hypothetical protein